MAVWYVWCGMVSHFIWFEFTPGWTSLCVLVIYSAHLIETLFVVVIPLIIRNTHHIPPIIAMAFYAGNYHSNVRVAGMLEWQLPVWYYGTVWEEVIYNVVISWLGQFVAAYMFSEIMRNYSVLTMEVPWQCWQVFHCALVYSIGPAETAQFCWKHSMYVRHCLLY